MITKTYRKFDELHLIYRIQLKNQRTQPKVCNNKSNDSNSNKWLPM